jgi:hypothetical protein
MAERRYSRRTKTRQWFARLATIAPEQEVDARERRRPEELAVVAAFGMWRERKRLDER